MESGFSSWFKAWDTTNSGTLTREQIAAGLSKVLPAPPAARPGQIEHVQQHGQLNAADCTATGRGRHDGCFAHNARVQSRSAAQSAGACAHGCRRIRSCLDSACCEDGGSAGTAGGLWTTTISYDAADINADNLKQYDAIFLDSTTACFLDDKDPSVTAARRAAFMNVRQERQGYCRNPCRDGLVPYKLLAAQAAASGGAGPNLAATVLSNQLLEAGDKDHDDSVNQQEWTALAGDLFQKLDVEPHRQSQPGRFRGALRFGRCRVRTSSRNRSNSGRSSTL